MNKRIVKVEGTNKKFTVTYDDGYTEIFKNTEIIPYKLEAYMNRINYKN